MVHMVQGFGLQSLGHFWGWVRYFCLFLMPFQDLGNLDDMWLRYSFLFNSEPKTSKKNLCQTHVMHFHARKVSPKKVAWSLSLPELQAEQC